MFAIVLYFVIVLSQDCQSEWDNIINSQNSSLSSSDYYAMFLSSGFVMNNLGDYYECNQIESAKYVVIEMVKAPVIVYTFCGPEVCTKEDYYNFQAPSLKITFSLANDVFFPHEYQHDHYELFTTGAIWMIVFIGIILYICIVGTFFDFFGDDTFKESKSGRFFLCFSMIANGKLLLTRKKHEKHLDDDDYLEILDGIKGISIV